MTHTIYLGTGCQFDLSSMFGSCVRKKGRNTDQSHEEAGESRGRRNFIGFEPILKGEVLAG